jgi:hypothetical protein
MENKTHILRKLIDIPLDTATGLRLLAAKENKTSKMYIQEILIAYEKKNSKRNSKGQLI